MAIAAIENATGATVEMNVRKLRLDVTRDNFFWPPYIMVRRLFPEEVSLYYGHRWYVLVSFLWWEIVLDEAC